MFRRLIDLPEKPPSGGRKKWESLCSVAEMRWLLRRETSRADRTGRPFCLVLFRLSPGSRPSLSTCRLARELLKCARLTDEIGWFSDQYLAALLPDTSAAGAQIFTDRVGDAVERRASRPSAYLYAYPNPQGTALAESIEVPDLPAPVNGGHNGHANGGHANGGHANGKSHQNGHCLPEGSQLADDRGQIALMLSERPLPSAGRLPRIETPPARRPGLSSKSVQELLVHPMPAWKRTVDVLGGLVGLIVSLPVMAFAAMGILLTSGGPIIFKQKRSGLGGKPFVIYKFRTMRPDAEAHKQELRPLSEQDGPAFKIEKDPRLTPFGSILRKTSIDELPQLWNVVKGDMSLVGPRPLPVDETDACLPWHRRRLDVTPGLTCIWQVKGRSRVTFDEWVRMDVAYMRRRTLAHDLWLLLITIPAVLLRRGAR